MKKKLLLTLSVLGIFAFAGCSKGNKKTKEVTTEKHDHIEYDRNFKYEYKYTDDSRTIICSERKDENSEYVNYYKYYTKYDEKNYSILDEIYLINEDGKWEGIIKTVNEYSDKYSKLRQIQYDCHETENSWEWRYDSQTYYEYETIKGEKLEKVVIYYNGYGGTAEEDVMDEKVVNTYDSKGLLTDFENYEYNESDKTWELAYKGTLTRNNDNETTYIYYIPSGEDFVENSKDVYTFDQNDNIIKEENYTFVDSRWVLETRYINKYHNNNCIEKIYYEIDGKKETIYYKSEYLFDEKGNEIGYISYETEDGEVVPIYKLKYITDKFGIERFNEYYNWDEESSSWIEY